MKSLSKPKDKFAPFYSLKWSKLPVPDPATAESDVLHLPAIFTKREIAFKKGQATTVLRWEVRMITFRRLVDVEGNAAWAYPIDLPKQNARLN